MPKLGNASGFLYTFKLHQGMDPTNNLAERMLRPGVIACKIRFGLRTAGGLKMFGTISTCSITWRLQGHNVTDMIRDALIRNPGYVVICPYQPCTDLPASVIFMPRWKEDVTSILARDYPIMGRGPAVPAAVHAGSEQHGGAVARAKEGDFKLPLQDRRRDAEIPAQYDAQKRVKGGKDEQMADVDTTHGLLHDSVVLSLPSVRDSRC